MTILQPLLFAATLFCSLACLLNWNYRRDLPAWRVRRSLRLYALRTLAELPIEMIPRITLKAA